MRTSIKLNRNKPLHTAGHKSVAINHEKVGKMMQNFLNLHHMIQTMLTL